MAENLGAISTPGKDVELSAPATPPVRPKAQPAITGGLEPDYLLLGVPVGADLDIVEAAWRRLARRADPKRFPPGSEEEKRAGVLLCRINDAYARIRESVNPTEGRFGRLEL